MSMDTDKTMCLLKKSMILLTPPINKQMYNNLTFDLLWWPLDMTWPGGEVFVSSGYMEIYGFETTY